MGTAQRKGKSGAAALYISRNKAIRKLQLKLKDFRRLCIIKGIYPREPKNRKKAAQGSTSSTTFYYSKDIQYLSHEPLIKKLRDAKSIAKRIHRANIVRDKTKAKSLKDSLPDYPIDHIILERYPSFTDALRDLDDCLNMVFLFATIPPADRVRTDVIKQCQTLSREFQHYVMYTNAVRKVFLSVKGIYYQVEIKGETITWLVPYQFSQKVPTHVDYTVMLNFLEFYIELLRFVNFKLYTDVQLPYPPKVNRQLESGNADLVALNLNVKSTISAPASNRKSEQSVNPEIQKQMKSLNKVLNNLPEEADDSAADQAPTNQDEEDLDFSLEGVNKEDDSHTILSAAQLGASKSALQKLFDNQYFFLSREVPRNSLLFVIQSLDGVVGWDNTIGAGSPYQADDSRITFQVTDRPIIPNPVENRIYVQPQWVYDSVNAGKLLDHNLYGPGKTLPVHLSPFVKYTEGDYVPQEAFEGTITSSEASIKPTVPVEEELSQSDDSSDDSEEEAEAYQEELVAEAKNQPALNTVSKRKTRSQTAKEQEEADLKEMQVNMLNNKRRKAYEGLKKGIAKQEAKVNTLKSKKQNLVAKKNQKSKK